MVELGVVEVVEYIVIVGVGVVGLMVVCELV